MALAFVATFSELTLWRCSPHPGWLSYFSRL